MQNIKSTLRGYAGDPALGGAANSNYHEVLRIMMTEWVASVKPSLSEFARVEKALDKFKELLQKEGG